MRHARSLLVLGALFTLAAVGCAPPVLTVRHRLPSDLPLPPAARRVRLGEFTVADGPKDAHGKFLADTLAERFAASGAYEVVPGGAAADLVLSASLRIDVQDDKGTRTVRRMDPETRELESLDVPTLVRAADVRVELLVADPRDGRRIAAAETHETWRSIADPRVRGPLGLGRPDDPARVPPAETVVRELLGACADAFARMLAPREVVARVPLRAAAGPDARDGLAAARTGDFAAAARHFQAALDAAPDDVDVRFNLAAVTEAAGDLEAALAHYQKIVERSDGRDLQASDGALRLSHATAKSLSE